MADVFNYLSSRAYSIIGGGVPDSTFSIVIVNFEQNIEKINFQLPPENISETKSANYASENVLGRFEPIRMYTNSSATKISFEVKYYWLEDDLITNVNSWNGIQDNVNKLRACLYPFDSQVTNIAGAVNPADAGYTNAIISENAYNNQIGKLTPPPTLKLFFGDIYKGTPCILTNISVDYKGPWNDNGLAAVARRFAAQAQSRFSDGLKQNANIDLGNQSLDPAARVADLIPTNWGVKGYLLDALSTTITSDAIFPLETKISISLETMYPFGSQLTYQNIRKYKSPTQNTGISKNKNVPTGNTGITNLTTPVTNTPFIGGGGATGGNGAGGGW